MNFVKQSLNRAKNTLRRRAKALVPTLRRAKYNLLTRWLQLNNPSFRAAPRKVEWHLAESGSSRATFTLVREEEELVWKGARCSATLRPFFPETTTLTLPAERVGEIRHALFVGVRSSVGIAPAFVGPENQLVSDYSYDAFGLENHAIFGALRLPPPRQLPGLTALLHSPQCDDNFYAFALELMPKLHLMALAGFPVEKFDTFVVNRFSFPFQKELLRLAGVPAEKVVATDGDYHFSFERVVVTSISNTEKGFAAWRSDYLRSLLQVPPAAPTRRLYITRRTASMRRLANEDELLAQLAPYNFEVIDCGQLSIPEQARVFHEAAIIIGVHGAALTNLIYCSPGTRLIEIINVMSPTLYFNSISSTLQLNHQLVDAYPETRDTSLEQHRMHRQDYIVNPYDVIRALESTPH